MRQIDADKISMLGLTIIISERTGDILKGHARGKEEVIRRAVDVFNQTLLQAPTVNQWHYPSKGELPEKGREVWDGYEIIYYSPDLKKWYRFEDDELIEAPYAWCYLLEPPKEEA